MKLNIEFTNSCSAERILRNFQMPEPVFITHDGVSGQIRVDSMDSASTLSEALMEVRLVGYVKTSMIWAESLIATAEKKSLGLSHKVLDLLQRPPLTLLNTASSQPNESYHFHFSLTPVVSRLMGIPTGRDRSNLLHHVSFWDSLPSSLEEKSSMTAEWKSSAPTTTVSVIYQVQAKLYLRGALLASVTHKVCIFDCSEVAPPLCLGDFVPEYNSRRETVIRKNVFQKLGTMSIEATQPDPLVFTGAEDSATTKILLQVSFRKTHEELGGDEPGLFDAAITWRLQSSTFVSVQKMDGQPTMRQAAYSSSMVRLAKTGQGHRLKMIWSEWTRTDWPDSVCNGTTTRWTAVYPVWLSLQSSSTLAPTFSLPCVSRRYSILLDVSVSGPGRSRTSLKIPVQVIYRSKVAISACLPDDRRSHLSTENVVLPFQAICDGDNAGLPPYMAQAGSFSTIAVQSTPMTTLF